MKLDEWFTAGVFVVFGIWMIAVGIALGVGIGYAIWDGGAEPPPAEVVERIVEIEVTPETTPTPVPTPTAVPTVTPTPEPGEVYAYNDLVALIFCNVFETQENCDARYAEILERARDEDLERANYSDYTAREIPVLLVEREIVPILQDEPEDGLKQEICAKSLETWGYQLEGALQVTHAYAGTNEFYGLVFRALRAAYLWDSLKDNCARFDLHEQVKE